MSESSHAIYHQHLREQIISQCVWSDTYSSLKHILKRADNQLPLLVSFRNADDREETPKDDVSQPILFFDRTVSNKLLFTPLRQVEDQEKQFEVYPRHCTFATTELFKGLFEFVLNGQRASKVFGRLEQLVSFAASHKCPAVFMSRDRVECYYLEPNATNWSSKKYPQGAFFHGQRIHQPSGASLSHRKGRNDHLECLDEEGFSVFLKMSQPGRFSLIATAPEQLANQPELFLHSTQTVNVGQLIKNLTLQTDHDNDCIRLVRGSVPHNFHCQHLRLVREHIHDVLVGLTEENLVVEWNLDSHAPCRYATNLNDILSKLSGAWEELLLETYMDQARTSYRESFQHDMQLISTRDWAAFYEYWKWTGDVAQSEDREKAVPYQGRQRFHLVASLQDLSDSSAALVLQFQKNTNYHRRLSSQSIAKTQPAPIRKPLTDTRRAFLSEMSQLLSMSPHGQKKPRMSLTNPITTKLLAAKSDRPFDNSIYDSNQLLQPSRPTLFKHNSR